MKHLFFYFLICTGFIFSTQTQAQTLDKNNLETKIDSLIPTQVNDSTPGLIIGVVKNGELIFSKGYGLANISYGIPNNPKMVFNTGSVSKQFLGYAFAMLHVDGKLNIDDPVNNYLENWPEFEQKVTLRHLLTHTSGYREAYTMSNLAGRSIGVDRLSREECLEVVRKQPQLEFIPGSQWTYNSTAWVILAEILEKVTGQSADYWVEENILQPLKMNDTQIESYVGEVINNAAESYSYNVKQGYINEDSNRAIFGAAEVYSNIPDLVKWITNFKTAEIGGKEVNELFLDPYILNDGFNSEYALGINNSTYRGLKRYRHTGGHEAFATQLSYYPDYDLGIVTISNFGGKGWLPTTKIAELFLEEYMTSTETKEYSQVEIKKEKLEQFEGFYVASTFNRTIELSISEGSLTMNSRNKLIPVSQNTFGMEDSNGQIQIEKLTDEETQLTIINNTKTVYNRVEKWVPNESDLTAFEGDYWSNELETVYHLTVKDKKLNINHRWLGNLSIEPISKDFFKSEWGYYVKFARDNDDNISGLSIYSGRTLNVFFQRMK
jgi:CubicO group peptidase (beta-lactamase class C family)